MHSAVKIGNDKKLLPKTVAFYNATKERVDIVNQIAKNYTALPIRCKVCKNYIADATSERWPVKYFYNILDLTAINGCFLQERKTGARMN